MYCPALWRTFPWRDCPAYSFHRLCVKSWLKKQWRYSIWRFWKAERLNLNWHPREGHGPWNLWKECLFSRWKVFCALSLEIAPQVAAKQLWGQCSEIELTIEAIWKRPSILRQYYTIIGDQLRSGVIERVNATECLDFGKVYYLPHHEVVRRDVLTSKLRTVFDASSNASGQSPSLNDCLYSGLALTPTIFPILLRFSERKIALVGDIEKAFVDI